MAWFSSLLNLIRFDTFNTMGSRIQYLFTDTAVS